jgi:hypothetical protein
LTTKRGPKRDWRSGLPPISGAYSHFTECSFSVVIRINLFSRIEDGDTKGASRSPLAVKAMAHGDLTRAALAPQFNIAAIAAGYTRFHMVPPRHSSVESPRASGYMPTL